jgi:hypothetical protein
MNSTITFLKEKAQHYVNDCKHSTDFINLDEKDKDLYEFIIYRTPTKFYDYLLANEYNKIDDLYIEDWLNILAQISQGMVHNDEEPIFLPTDFCKSQIINGWFTYYISDLDLDIYENEAKINISIVCADREYPIGTFYLEDKALNSLVDNYLKKSGCNDELINSKMNTIVECYLMYNDDINYKYIINELIKVYKSNIVTAIVVNEERININ